MLKQRGWLKCSVQVGVVAGVLCQILANPAQADRRRPPGSFDGRPEVSPVGVKPVSALDCFRRYPDDANAKLACTLGLLEAQSEAEAFGRPNGTVHGYLQGYSRGLFNAFQSSKDDEEAYRAGQTEAQGLGGLTNAQALGSATAEDAAKSSARNEVIRRFSAALGTAQMPSPEFTIPSHVWGGVSDGYTREGLPRKSETDLLTEETRTMGDLVIYNALSASDLDIYLFKASKYGVREIWSADGSFGLGAQSSWRDHDRVWSVCESRRLGNHAAYLALPSQIIDIVVDVKQPDGTVIKQRRHQENPDYYRAIYRQVFKDNFDDLAQYHFAQAYYGNLPLGYAQGLSLGELIGKDYARQSGRIFGYNERYQKASIDAYHQTYENAYGRQFQADYVDYSTHPKLSFGVDAIEGESEDGSFLPGERIRARLTVTNLGGVAKNAVIQFSGGVENSNQQTVGIPALSRQSFATDYLAAIPAGAGPSSRDTVAVNFDGMIASRDLTVHHLVELRGAAAPEAMLDVSHGTAVVQATIANPRTATTPAGVTAQLFVAGRENRPITLEAGQIAGGATTTVSFNVAQLDPLRVIEGGVGFKVVVSINGQPLDATGGTIGVSDREPVMTQYFDDLLTGETANTGASSREARLGDVKAKLKAYTFQDINAHPDSDPWDDGQSRTTPGYLALRFAARAHSAEALAQYQDLGNLLTTREMKDAVSVWHGRDHYIALVKKFAPKINESKKKG